MLSVGFFSGLVNQSEIDELLDMLYGRYGERLIVSYKKASWRGLAPVLQDCCLEVGIPATKGGAMGSENLLCLLDREDFALIAAGFEPTEEEGTLWRKAGVWFGREAALQSARKQLSSKSSHREHWIP
jgi:hypothetical protein